MQPDFTSPNCIISSSRNHCLYSLFDNYCIKNAAYRGKQVFITQLVPTSPPLSMLSCTYFLYPLLIMPPCSHNWNVFIIFAFSQWEHKTKEFGIRLKLEWAIWVIRTHISSIMIRPRVIHQSGFTASACPNYSDGSFVGSLVNSPCFHAPVMRLFGNALMVFMSPMWGLLK